MSGDIRIEIVTAEPRLWEAARVMNDAFSAPEATEHDVARLQQVLTGGGFVAVAVDTTTGDAVGAGQLGSPHHGVAEVAGIAVRPSHRRRGIGGAITALLTRAGADAGITTPFLTPADNAAARVYARTGYQNQGEALHISLP